MWALLLKRELQEQISRAERLERESRHPLVRLLKRFLKLIMKLSWKDSPLMKSTILLLVSRLGDAYRPQGDAGA